MVKLLTSHGKSWLVGDGWQYDFEGKVRTWDCSNAVLTTDVTVKTLPLYIQCPDSIGRAQQRTATKVTVIKHGCELWDKSVQTKAKIPKQCTLDSFSSLNHIHSHLLSHAPLLADDNPASCETIKQLFPPLHSCSFVSINLTTELSRRLLSSKPWQILWCE